jgi:hypothetical protein
MFIFIIVLIIIIVIIIIWDRASTEDQACAFKRCAHSSSSESNAAVFGVTKVPLDV